MALLSASGRPPMAARSWWVLDSYGCEVYRTFTLWEALAWTVPDDCNGRLCSICTKQNLGGGVYEVKTCEGLYTVTRHAPEAPLNARSGDAS